MSIITTQEEYPVLDNWLSAVNNNELENICELYHDNAVLIPIASDVIRRNAAEIKAYYSDLLQQDRMKINILNRSVVYENGHMVYVGNYVFNWYEGEELRTAKSRYSFVTDKGKILVHHSGYWPDI